MINKCIKTLENLKSLTLLFLRLLLAYGFYVPAMMKVKDVSGIAEWFKTIHIPFPLLNAYLATGTEVLGVFSLTLGLFTRLISIPLIITMLVAIVTVHWSNGFNVGDNGFEIPLYYIAMLLVLVTNGAGKISLDNLLFKNKI